MTARPPRGITSRRPLSPREHHIRHTPIIALTLLLLASPSCSCGDEPGEESTPPDTGDSPDSVPPDSPPDSDDTDPQVPIVPEFVCPIDQGLPEEQLDVVLTELDGLDGHGWNLAFETDRRVLPTLYFAPVSHGDACLYALSDGLSSSSHSIDITNLRLDTSYRLLLAMQDLDGVTTRSQDLELTTGNPAQTLPTQYSRDGIEEGTVWFDAEIHGNVPADLVLTTNLGLCSLDYGMSNSGAQALLLDGEGYLVGNYVTADEISGFAQVHVTATGAPNYAAGNKDLRLHIGGGESPNAHGWPRSI